MKHMLLLAVLAVIMASCMKEYIEQPVIDEPVSDDIKISVKSAMIDGQNIYAEVGSSVIFQAESSLSIKSYSWIIAGSSMTGNPVTYKFTQAGTYEVSLVAVDSNGISHAVKATVEVVSDISNVDPIKFFSSEKIDASGFYTYTFYCKKRLAWAGAAPYFIQGDQTSWKKVYVAPADTNYYFRDNQFGVAGPGEYGTWVKVKFNFQADGVCRFGLGKERASGDPWSDYSGSVFADPDNGSVIQFRAVGGQVWPVAPVSVPGDVGDTIVSLKIEVDTVRIFINNLQDYSGDEFIQFIAEDGSNSGGIVAEKSVANFPKWGVVAVSRSSSYFDTNGYLRFKAGLDKAAPSSYYDLSKSLFYNNTEGLIKFKIARLGL